MVDVGKLQQIAPLRRPFSIRSLPGFTATAILCFVLLYAPLVPLVVYSFNAGTSLAFWEGFSLRWYVAAWENDSVQDATIRSLIIAVTAALDRNHTGHDGSARDHAHETLQGSDRHLCPDQSTADGA